VKRSSQQPRASSTLSKFCVFLFATCLLLCGISSAAPSITLSKKSGPPTSRILVSGRGFEPNVGVDIFFDTKDKALVVTNGKGEFHDAPIYAPRSARPGEHWVTALERNNDKGAQEAFLVQTNWSQFHFDADGTRLNPYENVLNPGSVGKLDVKWTRPVGDAVWSAPAVVNGTVYFGSNNHNVYALDAETGTTLWSYSTGQAVYVSSPSVANGIVYIGSEDSNVYALNARTGAKIWSYTTGGYVLSSPTVANGVVYVGSFDGKLYALNARTGATVWTFNGGSESSAVVSSGVLYFGSGNEVISLNAATGSLLWSYATGNTVFSSPAVANGVVYVGSYDNHVYALNASTGTLIWSYPTNSNVYSSPAVAKGIVYVASEDGTLYALNAITGAKVWSYTTGTFAYSSPVVANGVVYIGAEDTNLYALSAKDGTNLWTYAIRGVDAPPTVVNGTLYVALYDGAGDIYAFSLSDGDRKKADSKRPDLKTLRPDLNLKPAVD
jgi:outer membrane protein assembly factor BamB